MHNAAQQTITGTTLVADIIDMIEFSEFNRRSGSMVAAREMAEECHNPSRYIAEWVLDGCAENEEETIDDMWETYSLVIEHFGDIESAPVTLDSVAKELNDIIAEAEEEAAGMQDKAKEIATEAIAEAKEIAPKAPQCNAYGEQAVELDIDGLLRVLVTQELRNMTQESQDDGRKFWGECENGATYYIAMEQPDRD